MGEPQKQSIKISEKSREFYKNLGRNRIKADTDKSSLSYWKYMDLIVKYFKSNNNAYLGLVNLEE